MSGSDNEEQQFTKRLKIRQIKSKYSVDFPEDTKDSILDDVLKGKYHRIEVFNLSLGRKATECSPASLGRFSPNQLREYAEKQSKRKLPKGLDKRILIDIILKRFNVSRLSDKHIEMIGKKERSTASHAAGLYAGWIPFIRKKLKKSDRERGKEVLKDV